jgi:hypothetical protein
MNRYETCELTIFSSQLSNKYKGVGDKVMASSVTPCDLEAISFTEEYILSLEAFLTAISLTAFEAQIILEVSKYPSQHVDLPTLARKIPKFFNENPGYDLDASVKSLRN